MEDASNNFTDWAAGTVLSTNFKLDAAADDPEAWPATVVPYRVALDSGVSLQMHACATSLCLPYLPYIS